MVVICLPEWVLNLLDGKIRIFSSWNLKEFLKSLWLVYYFYILEIAIFFFSDLEFYNLFSFYWILLERESRMVFFLYEWF